MEREIYFYILHCVFFYNLLGKFNDKDSFSIVSQNIDARRNCAEKNEFDSVFYVFYVTRIQLMIQQFIFQLFSKISIETLLISETNFVYLREGAICFELHILILWMWPHTPDQIAPIFVFYE